MRRIRNTFKDWSEYKDFYTHEQREERIKMGYINPNKPHYVSRYMWAFEKMKLTGAKHILDVGSGMGDFPIYLSQHSFIVDCVDPKRSDYEYFQKQLVSPDYLPPVRIKTQHNPIHSYNEFFEEHKPRRSYDFITAFEVIEHVFEIEPFIKKIEGLLNDGGHFVFSTPVAEGEFGEKWDNPQHLWVATEESIRETFKDWNILDITIMPDDSSSYVVFLKKKGDYKEQLYPELELGQAGYYLPYVVDQVGHTLEELIELGEDIVDKPVTNNE